MYKKSGQSHDPGEGVTILDCARLALLLRGLFDKLKLKSFAKTSGSKGMQVYVPLNTPVTFAQTKQFARTIAAELTRQHPGRVTADMKKSLRTGKVFIDWSQNDAHKTTVCVYSLRGKDKPTASTPLKWTELETAVRQKAGKRLVFTAPKVIQRATKFGDLFAPILKLKQKLPALRAIQHEE